MKLNSMQRSQQRLAVHANTLMVSMTPQFKELEGLCQSAQDYLAEQEIDKLNGLMHRLEKVAGGTDTGTSWKEGLAGSVGFESADFVARTEGLVTGIRQQAIEKRQKELEEAP